MTPSIRVKDLFKQQTLKEPKLAQLGKVLNTCLTTMCSEGKLMTGPMVIE